MSHVVDAKIGRDTKQKSSRTRRFSQSRKNKKRILKEIGEESGQENINVIKKIKIINNPVIEIKFILMGHGGILQHTATGIGGKIQVVVPIIFPKDKPYTLDLLTVKEGCLGVMYNGFEESIETALSKYKVTPNSEILPQLDVCRNHRLRIPMLVEQLTMPVKCRATNNLLIQQPGEGFGEFKNYGKNTIGQPNKLITGLSDNELSDKDKRETRHKELSDKPLVKIYSIVIDGIERVGPDEVINVSIDKPRLMLDEICDKVYNFLVDYNIESIGESIDKHMRMNFTIVDLTCSAGFDEKTGTAMPAAGFGPKPDQIFKPTEPFVFYESHVSQPFAHSKPFTHSSKPFTHSSKPFIFGGIKRSKRNKTTKRNK